MFLHSGASLHGHEYSNRHHATAGQAAPRRNSLLRSSFSTPVNRSPPYVDSSSPSPNFRTTTSSSLKKTRQRPVSDYSPNAPETVVRFMEPLEHVAHPPTNNPEAMHEDGASTVVSVSDSETSRAASSTRQIRRRSARLHTSYLLAQAPPSLNKKQRLLHIRPKLLLQLQQVPDGQRPRPVIDVYPTSGIVNTAIAAHLCKRFPRLSRIKSEKSIQDVLLFKSEDYTAPGFDSDSDGDVESIKDRDIIAILSPLAGQDKAEIALPDGTVWVAAPRVIGGVKSYEFTTVDQHGITTTARWVRRPMNGKSQPSTKPSTPPMSPGASSHPLSPSTVSFPSLSDSPPPNYKFTFSIIDPSSRRHPIMATLQPSSLDIQDSYTTVSQSSSKYPPTSPQLGSPDSSDPDHQATTERTTLPVEEWQKCFIQISALWVALRHGWVPHYKPGDFIRESTGADSPVATKTHNRSRSYSTGTDVGQTGVSRGCSGRKRHSQPPPPKGESPAMPGFLPRRATSTGAARMQKIRAEKLSDATETNETTMGWKKGRRVLSCDWNGSFANRHSTALANIQDVEFAQNTPERSGDKIEAVSSAKPSMITPSKRPMSELINHTPHPSFTNENHTATTINGQRPNPLKSSRGAVTEQETKTRKHHKWKSVTNWFTKLRAR
ncbi:hypothetical protein PFICI_14202 [Pestalotiopsis fici W106-1]|uniref:Uncharacterized protein n=1 Tax=Pestalotiopsis fici (strain W106-1 / CGMCC3.15140) TaxID=1229662 RepID=W3WNE7_PESFW|nr:uncharacterized protein PFICI_14202 [Pestalotiopsis fici W106-1]ETS74336.1 hypothetical protein PFICI_14202 [Pestalotiopsis fici W106-1]